MTSAKFEILLAHRPPTLVDQDDRFNNHPMEPEEVPPLPGFDVTAPNNKEFFFHAHLEGVPTRNYRSTEWPRLRRRYQGGGPAMISGPYGHGQ